MISCTLKIRGGSERDCYGKKAGKGALIQWEKSATLGVSQDQYLIVLDEPSYMTQEEMVRGLYPQRSQATTKTESLTTQQSY